MSKNTKNVSQGVSKKAIIGCLVAVAVIFTGGVVKYNTSKQYNVELSTKTKEKEEEEKGLKINPGIKTFSDIAKAEELARFNVKFPNKTLEDSSIYSYDVQKFNDKVVLQMNFRQDGAKTNEFTINAFTGDIVEVLKGLESANTPYEYSLIAENEATNINAKNGQVYATVITGYINKENALEMANDSDDLTYMRSKYYVWEEDGIKYAIKYNVNLYGETSFTISEDKLVEIVNSVVDLSKVENEKYKINKVNKMGIYAEDDLEKAKSLIGFNPKLPSKINASVQIEDAFVEPINNGDLDNNSYKLTSYYTFNSAGFSVTQSKFDENNFYSNAKNNGYLEYSANAKLDIDKLNIYNVEVFKFTRKAGITNQVGYFWNENGVYYSLLCNTSDIRDFEYVVKAFINLKAVE